MAARKKKNLVRGLAVGLLGGKAGIITAGIELATPLVKTLVANFNDPQKRAEILAALPKMNSGADNSAQGLTARAEALTVQLRVLAETADKPGETERVAGFQARLDTLRKAVPFAAMSGKGSKRALRRLAKNFDELANDILAALVDEVSQLTDAPEQVRYQQPPHDAAAPRTDTARGKRRAFGGKASKRPNPRRRFGREAI